MIHLISTIDKNIEKQANDMLVNNYLRFPTFVLYFRGLCTEMFPCQSALLFV